MSVLRINFAPRSIWQIVYRARPLSWMTVCAGIALCTGVAITTVRLHSGQNMLESARQRMQEKVDKHEARRTTHVPIPATQADAVNQAVMQLNLPWRDVLDAIEIATPDTVALLALEPDAQKHRVKGTAEAKNGEMMVAYIEDLKRQGFFDEVVLTRHEINDQDANRPFRFQFEAQWREKGK